MVPFKGFIYSGVGEDIAYIYRSATGNAGTWTNMFSTPFANSVDAFATTAEGAGYIYSSIYANGGDLPKIYKSVDGITWTGFYNGFDRMSFIVPFKGLGTVDSIYLFENSTFGTIVLRLPYDSNDPMDTLGTVDTVLNFPVTSIYSTVSSTLVSGGKMYAGTNGLWSTADGSNWTQNPAVGADFGDPNNISISALESFGGYIYAGTYNFGGAQIWRSDDEVNWTMVAQYTNYEMITDFAVTGGTLWATMSAPGSGPGQIVKSTDGTTFTVSRDDGFGLVNNTHIFGNFCVYNNNLFFGSQNYGSTTPPPNFISGTTVERGISFTYGGQIWRTCLLTPPSVSLGPDLTVCDGVPAYATAGPGFSNYTWSDGSTSSLLTAFNAGSYYVIATDANGCDALDTIKISHINAPILSVTNPAAGAATVCYGDSIPLTATGASNLRVPQAPIHKPTNVPVDYSLGNTYDTIAVTGISECSCIALLSVTIDSLYHPFNGDVGIGLYSPSGYYIDLLHGGAAYDTNFVGTEFRMDATVPLGSSFAPGPPYTGQYLPVDDFSNFTGSATGNWVLQLNDNYITDNGVLKGWSIRFSVADTVVTYSWSPSGGITSPASANTTLIPTASQTYSLTATNSSGCHTESDVNITVPQISITTANDSICHGSSSTLVSTGGTGTIWSPSGSLSSSGGPLVTASPVTTTTYYVADSIMGCPATDSITIFVDPIFAPSAGADQTICAGDSVSISAAAGGGTAPYTYSWNDGTNSYTNQTEQLLLTANTTYTLDVTDAFGCLQSDVLMVTLAPSTDIYGNASYTGGSVINSNVVLYKYEPVPTHFDTIQLVTTDAAGNFHFTAVPHEDYLVELFPAATYPTLVPSYYGNVFLWDSATVVSHDCAINDTLNIAVVEETSFGTGPGYLHGTIREGDGFGRAPGDPVPGIDVKLGRNPGGQMVTQTETDGGGEYSFSNVAFGAYTVYADVPGLGRDSSYTFVVDSTHTTYNYLNYVIDSVEVHYVPDAGIGINPISGAENKFNVYPNPSKGNVTIAYSIGSGAQVSLGVYNVLGVQVSEVVNAQQGPGDYKYNINGKDLHLSSGVYFITLITNGKTSIHKIIITE